IIILPKGVTFEGGDLLAPDPEVVIVGHSERTTFSGVMSIANELFERTPVEHVLLVDLPKARYCMHLDTVFTFTSEDECVVFPPDRKSTRLNSSHVKISYAVFCLKKKTSGKVHAAGSELQTA